MRDRTSTRLTVQVSRETDERISAIARRMLDERGGRVTKATVIERAVAALSYDLDAQPRLIGPE